MTVNLPDRLIDEAKQMAAREGVSLEQFVAAAIEQKLGTHRQGPDKGPRVHLPLVPSDQPGSRPLTADRVAEILDQEDVSA